MRVALAISTMLVMACGSTLRADRAHPTAAASQPTPGPTLPEVGSLEELRQVPPVVLANGWRVRLGLAGGGTEAGPWMLLYCLAEYVRDDFNPTIAYSGAAWGKFLGPVFFTVNGQPDDFPFIAVEEPPKPSEALFCRPVLTAEQGDYDIRVYSQRGRLLAHRTVRVRESRPCYWQQLAGPLNDPGRPDVRLATLPKPTAAVPRFPGLSPVWAAGPEGMWPAWSAGSLPGQIHAATVPLPRKRPQTHALSLTLEQGSTLVVRSRERLMARPTGYLLARWWVNGRPVAPFGGRAEAPARLEGVAPLATEIRIALKLPENLGTLKPGDRVALQVLYSPCPYRPVAGAAPRDGTMADLAPDWNQFGPATMPLVSNRLAFDFGADANKTVILYRERDSVSWRAAGVSLPMALATTDR